MIYFFSYILIIYHVSLTNKSMSYWLLELREGKEGEYRGEKRERERERSTRDIEEQ